MTIAVLTFCRTINYGAALQCYALSSYLKSQGHSVSIINLGLPDGGTSVKRSLARRILSKAFRILRTSLKRSKKVSDEYVRYPSSQTDIKCFEEDTWKLFNVFSEHKIGGFTKLFSSQEDIKDAYPKVDLYIVGSDQVWNPKITRSNAPLYFFSFLKNEPRISYAASFGGSEDIDFGEANFIEIKSLLSKFNAVSVRDSVGINIMRNKFAMPAVQVVDPTLLLASAVYEELAAESNEDASGYLYEYKFIINDIWEMEIKDIANTLGLKVRSDGEFLDIEGFEYHPVQSIQGWLKVIKTSDFVISDSFHCTIFCILFKKQFITTPSYQGGEGRMVSLLRDLGIEDRFFCNVDEIHQRREDIFKPIDYEAVYEKLNDLSLSSKKFLNNELIKIAS